MSELKLESILNHPKFVDGSKLGNCEASLAIRAYLIYLNLSETHRWSDVEMKFNSQLNTIYVTGKAKEEDQYNTVVFPVDAQAKTDCEYLHTAMETLCAGNEGFLLAVCENDSTTVYYRIKAGLHVPKSVQEFEKPDEEEEDKGSDGSASTDEAESTKQEDREL